MSAALGASALRCMPSMPRDQPRASCGVPSLQRKCGRQPQRRKLAITTSAYISSGFVGSTRQLAHLQQYGPGRRCGSSCIKAERGADPGDRLAASLPYLVPLFDGLKYGRFFFRQFPIFAQLLAPLDPLIRLYFSFPFASLIVFFAVYAGIVSNTQNFSRYVRYNAMQSILLDIILVLPGLLESLFQPPSSGAGLQLYISAYNTLWLFVFISVAYAVGSCIVGQSARLPLIADAADQQVR